ncbi:hypothetical protein [Arabiibacter massiliensis]|uniref:hypothetical protein n=1 Tax=Arabiibacter massiliensis TaxID=1870985 RepID=UPI001E4EBA31|nr:hypothetical protein [Arabiibacter massiliensis]
MTAERPDDFPYEAKREPSDPAVREGYWRVAMGLQEVDGLKPSPYLRKLAREHAEGVRGLPNGIARRTTDSAMTSYKPSVGDERLVYVEFENHPGPGRVRRRLGGFLCRISTVNQD